MGVSGQESWSGLPFPSPGDPPDPGIKLRSPAPNSKFFLAFSFQRLLSKSENKVN